MTVKCPVGRHLINDESPDEKRDVIYCSCCGRAYSYKMTVHLWKCGHLLKNCRPPKNLRISRLTEASGPVMQFRYTKVSDSWRYVSIVLFPLLVIGLLLAGLTGAIMYMCDIEHWSRLYFLIGAGVLLILSCIASQWRNTYNFKFTGKDLTFWVTTPFCRHKKTYERVSRLRMRGIKNSKTSVDHVALGCLAGKKMPYFEPDFSMDVASYNFLLAYFDTWRPHDEEELAPHPKNMFAGLLKGAAQLGVVALRLGGKYFAGADGGVDIGDLDFGDSGSGDFDLGDIGFGDDS